MYNMVYCIIQSQIQIIMTIREHLQIQIIENQIMTICITCQLHKLKCFAWYHKHSSTITNQNSLNFKKMLCIYFNPQQTQQQFQHIDHLNIHNSIYPYSLLMFQQISPLFTTELVLTTKSSYINIPYYFTNYQILFNMSFLKKTNNISQNEITKETLNDINKPKQRKIFRRQPGDSPHSNDSRRSITRKSNDFMPSSYIRLSRESQPVECLTDRVDYSGKLSEKINFTPRRQRNITKVSDLLINKGIDPIHRKLEHAQEELHIKNRQLQLISEDRQYIKKQYQQLQSKYAYLQQLNRTQNSQITKYKEEIRKLTIQKRKLESQKASLNKKIQFLQKFNFSKDTKNLQSLRELHLQKQIQSLKDKVKGVKCQVGLAIQQQLETQKQELFNARKLIETLQINNACLQKKLEESNCFLHPDENYVTLRSKYKKFLIQYKELRKSFDNLQKEHQALKSKQLVNSYSDSFSLELSALNS